MLNFDEILLELSYRVEGGIVDLTNETQLLILEDILRENGVTNVRELIEKARVYYTYLNEATKKKKKSSKPTSKADKAREQARKQGLTGKGGTAWGPKGQDIVTHVIDKNDNLVKLEKPVDKKDFDKEKTDKDKTSTGGQAVYGPDGGGKVFSQSDSEANPAGTYEPENKRQRNIAEAGEDPQKLNKALDQIGADEKVKMLDRVEAGPGGAVASTGETLCTEAQSDMIQHGPWHDEVVDPLNYSHLFQKKTDDSN